MMLAIEPPAIVQILTDHGGTLGERVAVTEWLKRNGISVQIIGVCASACIWLFTLPRDQVCVAPDAWIGSHSHLGSPDDTIEWQRGRDLIAQGQRECAR